MTSGEAEFFRLGLVARRDRLRDAVRDEPEPSELRGLLREVDAALGRLDGGTFGTCEVCRGAIEPELLSADPLVRVCLDDLSPSDRESLEEDLALASRIQAGLLPPRQGRHGGWDVCYRFRPRLAVSGDYCDLIPGPGGADLALFVGDVSGKGIAASILMAHLHATFRTVMHEAWSLPELFARVNRFFCESTSLSQFATAIGARLSGSVIELCNAGHPPAIVVCNHRVFLPAAGGLPLGMFRTAKYECDRLTLAPGDLLVLYSDGLTEARGGEDELFGSERLARVVQQHCPEPAEEILQACITELERFTGGRSLDDDLTLLVARREE